MLSMTGIEYEKLEAFSNGPQVVAITCWATKNEKPSIAGEGVR